jgi:hypothetical protein
MITFLSSVVMSISFFGYAQGVPEASVGFAIASIFAAIAASVSACDTLAQTHV